jgi:hypothetical protein
MPPKVGWFPQRNAPVATVVQVPSASCTLVVDCTGCTPEGHTGRPDSKDGRSMGWGVGLNGRVGKLIRPLGWIWAAELLMVL